MRTVIGFPDFTIYHITCSSWPSVTVGLPDKDSAMVPAQGHLVGLGCCPPCVYPVTDIWSCVPNNQTIWAQEVRDESKTSPISITPNGPLPEFVFPAPMRQAPLDQKFWFWLGLRMSNRRHTEGSTEQPLGPLGLQMPVDWQVNKGVTVLPWGA